MKTKELRITESNARKLYKTASAEFKTTLEDTFGKEFFSGNIQDRVKSYEDACEELGEKPEDETTLRKLGLTDDEIAYRKIKTITRALNEGTTFDINDTNIKRWYPYYDVSSSGFVFGRTTYYCSTASAGDGSRLCFKSSELAEYAGTQFIELYKTFIK